ncbi:hypothetical protein F5Y00DRAFT_228345 [Daldinia vernicosa]|uniref:uncharacterized protein n=1 Tax=Daldinia vernicosa TaxID=114800 RepID=UPI0020085ACA|nr:uncharacterized protein F5Y00DRAFT_228345 [Daldinia vernicosa]KAI0851988.1 hypothetical protein F5Y00DRAFT_228345 [Daldinia vernicosa]
MANKIELQRKDIKGDVLVDEAVFNILNDYLQLDSSVSTAQVAATISKLPPEPEDDSKTLDDGFFFDLWRGIVSIAEQIPYEHAAQDKLVKLMRELTLLSDTGLTVWELRLWTDLPILAAVFREYLNGPAQSKIAEEQARIDEAWIRFHAFSARLMGAGVIHFATQPIWMLRDALEEENNPPKSSALDRGLITAAMYIEFFGAVMVERLAADPNPKLSSENRRLLKGGPLFHGEPGLRWDRWEFWTRRFREEAEKTSTKEARDIALRAARLMEVWSETRLNAR